MSLNDTSYTNVEAIKVNGTQKFLGKEIPVIYGGFGKNQKVILAKTIAEIHGEEVKATNQRINMNRDRFKDGVDLIDLKVVNQIDHNLLKDFGFTQMQISKANNIYLLSERGYAKLIKIMDSDLAWDIHDQLLDEYFAMREEKELDTAELSPELRMFKQIFDTVAKNELAQKQIKAEIQETKEEIQNIRDVVAINATDWRKDTTSIINKIGSTLGGDYQFIRNQSYELLEQRAKCKLSIRQTNLKRQMLENGCSKSKVDKVSKLDVIDNDNRLKEIYIAVIKEMAIKYNVA